MFDRLIASKTSGTVSVLVHAGVCAAAVLATLRPQQVPRAASLPIVLSLPLPSREWTHQGGSDGVRGPTPPPIDVPRQPPIELPPIDAGVRFDPKLLLRSAGEAIGDHGVDGPPDGPWSLSAVDDPPALLPGPPLGYPAVPRPARTPRTAVAP